MYRSLLVQLTLSIRQIIGADALSKPEATSPLIASVVTYIQNHFRDPELNVTQLAQYAYVSREYLSRLFKEYTMQSIHAYLTGLRMQACRQDIADGKRVLDACLENGFSNYSSFVKTFRKMYGATPQEYRSRLRSAIKAEATGPTRRERNTDKTKGPPRVLPEGKGARRAGCRVTAAYIV